MPNAPLPSATATGIAITATDTPPPLLTSPELGQPENPLIFTLASSSNTPAQIAAAKEIARQFTERTGYTVVVVNSEAQSTLVNDLERGNAHIVVLDPLAYALAYQKGLVQAAFTSIVEEQATYGAQFIAARRSGFTSYFDSATNTNLTDAPTALAQFNGKKPCWSDETSPSGYIIPLGILNQQNVPTSPAAFVQGHPTVVRSIYLGGICDFGATYIDARKFPSLEDQYPDLIEQVQVIWQIPAVIPYDVLAFSTQMPEPMRALFASLVPAILQIDTGSAAFQTAFEIDNLLAVNDAFFEEFREYVILSRVNLNEALR